jgi:hypothetical protein
MVCKSGAKYWKSLYFLVKSTDNFIIKMTLSAQNITGWIVVEAI